MRPTTVPICTLLFVGCFHDPGDNASVDQDTSGETSQTFTGDGSSSDETGTSYPAETTSESDTGSSGSTESGASGTSGDTSTDGSATSSDGCASPVDVEVDGAFEAGEARTLYLDFDEFPGRPGDDVELCITFTTTNPASARTVTIGGEVLIFGPCGGEGPGPSFMSCQPFVKPAGLTEVIIDNSTFSPGCQGGFMDDLVLQFGCLSGA